MDKMEILEQKEREQEKALILEYMKRKEAEERERFESRRKPRGSAYQMAKGARDKRKAKRKAARQSRKGR